MTDCRVLVVEGVTGAGKSTLLRELEKLFDADRSSPSPTLIPEDDTLGSIMTQVRDPDWLAKPTFEALEQTLDRIESTSLREGLGARFVVERFHLTTYALYPHWDALAPFDDRLLRIGARQVLLTYPEEEAAQRSLDRPDRVEEGWTEQMVAWYGSYGAALDAVRDSQRKRIEALALTKIPTLRLDAGPRAYDDLARRALAFWRDGAR